ncbi:YceI family protein [Sulfurovum sp.]|uniref:YceI family protein n=1 Tax=Sulfurovum sp. TaxID=1969726 RepID=UPI0025FBFE3F|nr:YceI family protein [Sulfurovum sp.]
MKRTLLPLLAMVSIAYATSPAGCTLVQPSDMNVTWKAYKTLGKLGVGGQFTAVKYTAHQLEGKNFRELFVGSKVSIDISKINTGNPARDETLVKNFFGKLKDKTIEAKIVDIKKTDKHVKGKPRTGTVNVEITMNEKTLIVPMKYHYSQEHFQATGTIDLFDFGASDALASINKSCYDLHKGKTWNDVTIGFSTTVKATLCNVEIKK